MTAGIMLVYRQGIAWGYGQNGGAAGGRNAAAEVSGNMKETSPENVLFWQPDIIIIGAGAGSIADSDYATLFDNLKAVKNHQVWQNPAGVFPRDRYGTEATLISHSVKRVLNPPRQSPIVSLAVDS